MTATNPAAVMPSEQTICVDVVVASRDRLSLRMTVSNGVILESQLTGIGCRALLNLLVEWRPKLTGALSELSVPMGDDHASMLMREVILKAKGEWNYPYTEEELCHCRAVPTAKVDAAIIGGCRTVQAVSRETSAATSCGTCRTDIEKILKFRLGKS